MIPTLPHRPRRAATALLAGLALTPLAACGGDEASSGAGGGLAGFAPATAAFYAEGVVRPEGDQKRDLDALVAKFAPGRTVDQLVGEAFRESGDGLDFERDVKPWLGERAAIAVTGAGPGGGAPPDVAAIVETTDADRALAVVRKNASRTLEERSHGGAAYLLNTEEKTAGGIVDEKLVVGTEAAFKAVVDATKGEGLDAKAEFSKVVDAVDEDALGFVYGDLRRAFELVRQAADPGDARSLESARELLDRRGLSTFAAGLSATPELVKLRAAAPMKDDGQGDAPAQALAALPAGSWAAIGLGDLGKGLTDGLDSLMGLSMPGFDVQSGLDQLQRQIGIDVQRDVLDWMGQAGLFARGTSLTDIGGALVVQSKDPAATKAALAKARTLAADSGLQPRDLAGSGIDDGFSLRPGGAPVELFAALAGDRFVLAVNRAALDEALDPARRLADDDAFKAAAEQLGDGMKPAFLLDFPKISGLIGLAAGGQPGFARAKASLDKVGTIVAGSKRDGDLERQTLVVGIR